MKDHIQQMLKYGYKQLKVTFMQAHGYEQLNVTHGTGSD